MYLACEIYGEGEAGREMSDFLLMSMLQSTATTEFQ